MTKYPKSYFKTIGNKFQFSNPEKLQIRYICNSWLNNDNLNWNNSSLEYIEEATIINYYNNLLGEEAIEIEYELSYKSDHDNRIIPISELKKLNLIEMNKTVICINKGGNSYLTINKEYEVESEGDNYYNIINDTNEDWSCKKDLFKIKENNMKKQHIQFAVKSKSFYLYEAFKKECETLGYIYNTSFNAFNLENFHRCDCLFFSDTFSLYLNQLSFSFSNAGCGTKIINLETNWNEAIELAKEIMDEYKKEQEFNIEIAGYKSNFSESGKVKFGCIEVTKENIEAILSLKELCNRFKQEKGSRIILAESGAIVLHGETITENQLKEILKNIK